MPNFNVIIKNKNVLDQDRVKKVSVTTRGVTFTCDLPSSYGAPSSTPLTTCAKGSFGAGLVWINNAGNYAAGEVTVSVQTSYGVLTGTNALPSGAAVNTMKIKIDRTAAPPVTITFT